MQNIVPHRQFAQAQMSLAARIELWKLGALHCLHEVFFGRMASLQPIGNCIVISDKWIGMGHRTARAAPGDHVVTEWARLESF
mmetsp:Transcript_40963/g.76164  ORF Transcript_40963/g.76164 Transcript_40963/m.76164 type:complete len:83 (+) Transcript_40963:209-457(+)